MSIWKIALLAGIGILAALVFALAPHPTSAAEKDGCFQVSEAVAAAEAQGGHMIALETVDLGFADQLLIVDVAGSVEVWPAREGCMLAVGPTPTLPSKPHGAPA